MTLYRSRHRKCSIKKGVLRNFTKFTGKHLCQSLFFNKIARLRLATLLKKKLWHRCLPVNFVKFLRTPFLLEHLRWLFLKLLKSYLKDRQQRVLLNGKTSLWRNILAGFSKGSVLGPLLFLIYINDLPDGLTRLCKIFTDDTSLFSKAVNRKKSEIEPNRDLKLASQWAYHWKMPFNPDPTKEAREVYFTYKRGNVPHEPLTFNNSKMQSALAQEHLGLILDFKLDFYQYIDDRINNCNKIIGAMRILSMTLSRESLLIIYKSFVRSL